MEFFPTVLPRGAVYQKKSAVNDAELRSWRRSNRQYQHLHYYSDSQSFDRDNQLQLPELLSYDVDHSALAVLQRTPNCRRKSSLPCSDGKSHVLRRSVSGSQLATASCVYAGARFSEAPSPKLLPLPPRHWLDALNTQVPTVCGEITKQLKSVLRVK